MNIKKGPVLNTGPEASLDSCLERGAETELAHEGMRHVRAARIDEAIRRHETA